MKKRRCKGFTLAELITVIAILGILTALALPLFQNAIEQARADTCAANRRGAQNLVDLAELREEGFIEYELRDAMSWGEVRDALSSRGFSPTEQLCPANGAAQLRRQTDATGEYTVSFSCAVHSEQ